MPNFVIYSIAVYSPITPAEPLPPLPDIPRGSLVIVERPSTHLERVTLPD